MVGRQTRMTSMAAIGLGLMIGACAVGPPERQSLPDGVAASPDLPREPPVKPPDERGQAGGFCPLIVPVDDGARFCGDGACSEGNECMLQTTDPTCVARCRCVAGAWDCAEKVFAPPQFTVSADCAGGVLGSVWLQPFARSMWLTDSTLYVVADRKLWQAPIPCGTPELVGSFDHDVQIVGALKEGIVLSVRPPDPMSSGHVWRYRPRSRLLDRYDEVVEGQPAIFEGEVHVSVAGAHKRFAWGSAPTIVALFGSDGSSGSPIGGAAPPSWFYTVGVGFSVRPTFTLTYHGLTWASRFVADDGTYEEMLSVGLGEVPPGRSTDGHLFVADQGNVVELLPSGQRATLGVAGEPVWVDDCDVFVLAATGPTTAPRVQLRSAPRSGGPATRLAELDSGGDTIVVASPRHVAWSDGAGVFFRTR